LDNRYSVFSNRIMDGLIDSMDENKWKEIKVSEKTGEFVEYFISRSRKQVDATTIIYSIENDSVDSKKVTLEFAKKDPLKNINSCEFRLSDDGEKVTGLDLNDDVIVLK